MSLMIDMKTNWYNEVSRSLDKIPDCITYYEAEYQKAKQEVKCNHADTKSTTNCKSACTSSTNNSTETKTSPCGKSKENKTATEEKK